MPRTYYAHPVDVIRKFDPTLSISDLRDGALGPNGLENVYARLREVESTLERVTGHAWRERRVGSDESTWEHHSASLRRFQRGVKVYLDHRHVLPIDYAAGDRIQRRTGLDSWKDITQETTAWEMDNVLGILRIHGVRVYRGGASGPVEDRTVRVKYRYGALGGEQSRGGQTTLDGAIGKDDTTFTVSNAARLPYAGTFLVGGNEYVLATNADTTANTVTVEQRGVNGTIAQDHADGTVVHYCPLNVRDAVASKTAAELLSVDDHIENLTQTREGVDWQGKMENWNSTWQAVLDKETDVTAV